MLELAQKRVFMFSVGHFAKKAQVSSRTLRHYESIGLLPMSTRGENNYRYYDEKLLDRVVRIKDLQGLGFSLYEIKDILDFADTDLYERLQKRLLAVDNEIENLQERRERLLNVLSVTKKMNQGELITDTERGFYMEAIREEIIESLKEKYQQLTSAELDYFQREKAFFSQPEIPEFISALKKCASFAKKNNLQLGPGRGSSPASIAIYALGFSNVNPMKYQMIPERLATNNPNIHIDVEFERGQEFVDYCQQMNRKLKFGQIHAFKMPLLDIINNVHKTIGQVIDYDSIDDNSDLILQHFQAGDMEKIFNFDLSPDAVIMKYEAHMPGYDLEKMNEYIRSQKIYNFRDITNISVLWRPFCKETIERIELYKQAKTIPFKYDFLARELQDMLEPNFGRLLYHEDLMQIISHYTGWELSRSNALRMQAYSEKLENYADWIEFKKVVSVEISDLVQEESKWAFCKPHGIAFAQFTKQTAILKSLHKEVYYAEIEKFEQKHGFKWDDIGARMKGVSLMQG
jgi:DNA polymerase III alpha subunit